MDTQQGNGLSLEALAQRLEGLQRENAENAQRLERLETLERENERIRSESEQMRSENTELRHEVSALRSSGTRRDELAEKRGSDTSRDGEATPAFEGRVSRRSLLSRAGAAAVAAVAAGTLMYPREARADHYGPGIEVDFVHAHHSRLGIAIDAEAPKGTAVNAFGHAGVRGTSSGVGDAGVHGSRAYTGWLDYIEGYGVDGVGAGSAYAGVRGFGYKGAPGVRGVGVIGVWATSSTQGEAGVYAEHKETDGPGVVADGKGSSHAGVLGRNTDGTGVRGVTSNNGRAGVMGEGAIGVWGTSSKTDYGAVYGQHTGSMGYGLVGDGKGNGAGVLGRNNNGVGYEAFGVKGETADAIGVKGIGRNGVVGESPAGGHAAVYGHHTGSSGYGVVGDGTGAAGAGVLGRNDSGYGGEFEGGKAQLKLKPAASAGKPTTGTHTKGEIYMDKAGALFVCTAGDGTTVGTWKKVNMKLV